MRLTTTTRRAGSVTIVDISGRIVLGQETASLRSLVTGLLSKGHNKILFNFADVDYIDSSGVGCLAGAFTSVRNHKGELKLLCPTRNVQDVTQKTKLYTVLDMKDDEAAPLDPFGKSDATLLMQSSAV
jgi:anti-sigma B factor antagonist